MRPQMKEKPGAEVNTHKTSIRSRGNLQSSLLRSASPHLSRAGNPRRRWLAKATPLRALQALPPAPRLLLPRARTGGAETGRRREAPVWPEVAALPAGAALAGRPLSIHCAWQPGERPRHRATPPPALPKISPAAPIGCAGPDVTKLLNFWSGGRVKVWGRPRWSWAARARRVPQPLPQPDGAAGTRVPLGSAVPSIGASPPPSPGSGFGKECAGWSTGTPARRSVSRDQVSPLRGEIHLVLFPAFPLPEYPLVAAGGRFSSRSQHRGCPEQLCTPLL